MTKYSWPLSTSSFNLWDKLSVCKFILSSDQYTMGEKVKQFEQKFSEYTNSKALFVSSGSAANSLMVETYKQTHLDSFQNTVIVVPSTTWISSVSCWLFAGYKIEFCDINLTDLSFNYGKLEKLVVSLKKEGKKIVLFPTSLVGFAPDFAELKDLSERYDCELFLDSCESTYTFSGYLNICGLTKMATTSNFFSHLCVSIEGGLLFCKDDNDYDTAKMIRSHGMSRVLEPFSRLRYETEEENPGIDSRFLFKMMGTNYRNTEIHAAFGLRDLTRAAKNTENRRQLYDYFSYNLNTDKYRRFERLYGDTPFCLPIVLKDKSKLSLMKYKLEESGIETRPIISFLPIQPCFKDLCLDESNYPNSKLLHENGLYCGLHNHLKIKDIDRLIKILNEN